jgi:hypothetical protein
MNRSSREIHRRDFFHWARTGLGGTALLSLLLRDGVVRAQSASSSADDPPPHHPPRAGRIIHVVACGGVSQIDTFDYKPQLAKFHGQTLSSSEKPDVFFGKVGLLRDSDWQFKQRRPMWSYRIRAECLLAVQSTGLADFCQRGIREWSFAADRHLSTTFFPLSRSALSVSEHRQACSPC